MFVVQRHQDTSQTFCQICVDLVFGVHEHDNILHKHSSSFSLQESSEETIKSSLIYLLIFFRNNIFFLSSKNINTIKISYRFLN